MIFTLFSQVDMIKACTTKLKIEKFFDRVSV